MTTPPRDAGKAEDDAPVRVRSVALVGAQIAALSFHPPLELWRTNLVAGIGGGPLLLIASLTTVAAWIVTLLLWRGRGLARLWMAGTAVSAGVFAFFAWAGFPFDLTRDPGPPHGIGALAFAAFLSAVLILAAYRFGRSLVVRTAVAALAAALIVPATYSLVSQRHGAIAPPAAASPLIPAGSGSARPDVFIIVLDGYGRADRMMDYYGFDNTPVLAALAQHGIRDLPQARANYSYTYAAVPSALTMEYIFDDDRPIRADEIRWINRISGGDNRLVHSMQAAGYRYVHIESGLAGSACGAAVDRCVPAPFLDETTWSLFSKTPLAHPLRSRYGHAFALDGLDRLQRLAEEAGRRPREPRVVFAHILLPHPPLFVGPDCSTRVREGMDGLAIGHPRYLGYLSARKAAYVDQVRCVNRRLIELADVMPPDSLVAFFGDHGPDAKEQLATSIYAWTDEQVRERMAIFMASRLSAGCRQPGPAATPINLVRDVVACALGADVPRLPDRSFLMPPAPAQGTAPPPPDATERVG